jgi:8-oxo-dGTP pyrophosphatase MutT (NUDIX family)
LPKATIVSDTAIPAATLILFRQTQGLTTHLFVERATTMAFAGGATVFPGGRVDEADRSFARQFPHLAADDAAARIAAIRETIEEAGVVVGIEALIDATLTARLRSGLHTGASLQDVLAREALTLSLDGLKPFARWCPNFRETRNFDARFFIAQAPDTDIVASADENETVHLFWASAKQALADADAGRLQIIFPTRRNLERLANLETFDAATAQAERIGVKRITPSIETIDGVSFLTIPKDCGYPVTSEPLDSVRRGGDNPVRIEP